MKRDPYYFCRGGIWLKVPTKAGIRIGSAAKKVKKAYGKPDEHSAVCIPFADRADFYSKVSPFAAPAGNKGRRDLSSGKKPIIKFKNLL